MLLRKTTVNLSILFQLQLRAWASALYLFVVLLFNSRLFYIGRIHDIGMANGLLLFFLLMAQILLLVFQSEGMNPYCDPINLRNRGKYMGIFLLQLFLLGFPAVWWTVPVMREKSQAVFWVLFFGIAILVLCTHMRIIADYRQMTEKEVRERIAEYKVQRREDLLEKSYEIRKRAYGFIGYMIGVALLFGHLSANILLAVVFAGLNIAVMVYWFGKPLKEFYALTDTPGAYRWGLIVGTAVSTLGYILVYLIGQDVIKISFFYGRTADEMGMLYLLFYIPFLKNIEMCCTMGIRMERVWER